MKKLIFRVLSTGLAAIFMLTMLTGCTQSTYERGVDKTDTVYVGKVSSAFPTSYMPWMSREGISPKLSGMLYETLLSYSESTDSYAPQLCKSWAYVDKQGNPIVKKDGSVDYDKLEKVYGGSDTTYMSVRFELDDNATWSDGQPVTVEDIYFTLDLATNQALSNHAGALVWTNDLLHKYQNGKLVRQGIFTYDRGAAKAGYKIKKSERNRVFYLQVNKVLGAITTLVSTILILPKHIYAPIISKENPINNTDPTPQLEYAYTHPVGSGRFVLDTKASNSQEIVIRKRSDYHIKAADGGDLYKFDTIKFILFQDVNVAIYALKKGHVDVLMDQIQSNYAPLFSNEKGIQVLTNEGIYNQCLVLNVNAPEDYANAARDRFKNINFRKAIALAVDQTALIKNVLSGLGAKVSQGLVSVNAEFFNPKADILPTESQLRVRQSNAILDKLYPQKDRDGYRLDNGKRITYSILASPGEQDLVAYLQVLFQKIGIEVKFSAEGSTPENTYLYVGNFDMTIQGVTLTASNMDIMYNAHFVNLTRSSNYGRLMNSKLKVTINQMRNTINRNNKYKFAEQLQLQTAQLFYKIPLYRDNIISVARVDHFTGWQKGEPGDSAFNDDSLMNSKKVIN